MSFESLAAGDQLSSSDLKQTLWSQKEHWRLPGDQPPTALSKKNNRPKNLETVILEIPDLGPGEITADIPLTENTYRYRVISNPQNPNSESRGENPDLVIPEILTEINQVLR